MTTLGGRVIDIVSAVEIITGRSDTSPVFGLFGSSLGGTACIGAAGLTRPAAIVVCAAPIRSRTIDSAAAMSADSEKSPPRPALLQFDVSVKIPALRDILVFHGSADEVVPYNDAVEIFAAASEPKRLVTLPGGDHRMTDPSHQKRFVEQTVTWFQERLPAFNGTR